MGEGIKMRGWNLIEGRETREKRVRIECNLGVIKEVQLGLRKGYLGYLIVSSANQVSKQVIIKTLFKHRLLSDKLLLRSPIVG